MSEQNKNPENEPIDLSELAGLQFSTAWTPSSNVSKFESSPRGEGGRPFKKREFSPKNRGEDRREGRRPDKKRRFEKSEGAKDGAKGKKFFKQRPAKKAPFNFTMEVLFYPEDAPFAKLSEVMKRLKRTYQLFDIAELVLEKQERFVILAKNLPGEDGAVKPLYCAQPANIPFETEAEAEKFALDYWLGELTETASVECEAPKGAFQVVNRCALSQDLLGAPNWHKYSEYVREYHASKYPNMPYEKFLSTIETVRDEALVNAWLEQMKTRQVYKLKDSETTFETRDAALAHIKEQKGEELVKVYEQVRMHGADIQKLPYSSRIRKNLEAAWAKQKQFPIVTANNIRGRLRRAGFTIYKRGSKGFAFVCAVKRKFLFEGESLSETPQKIFDFITEKQPVKAGALPYIYLGLPVPADVSNPAPLAEEHKKESEGGEVSGPLPSCAAELNEEDSAKVKEVSNELLWLISEGYVVEYADSSLQANLRLPKPKDKTKVSQSDIESVSLGAADEPIIPQKFDSPAESECEPAASEESVAEEPDSGPAEADQAAEPAAEGDKPEESPEENK